MNLLIDIGNTRTKFAVTLQGKFIYFSGISSREIIFFDNEIINILKLHKDIKKIIISSVIKNNFEYLQLLQKYKIFVHFLDSDSKIPVQILYKTPSTLGKDRIAGVVGANVLFPKSNILVFDSGTALTVDFINNKDEYLGGNISPGLSMRYKALNILTGSLPLVDTGKYNNEILGSDTESAITCGVVNGLIFEMRNYINLFINKFPDLKVVFTGGDTFFFVEKLKINIFAEENLIFIGLNRILEYNAK